MSMHLLLHWGPEELKTGWAYKMHSFEELKRWSKKKKRWLKPFNKLEKTNNDIAKLSENNIISRKVWSS